jgi:hypothetical protein
MIMAIPSDTSAAAMVMIKRVKNTPSSWCGYRYLLKATKLMLMLFRISSIDISMVIMFLREKKPYIPRKNKQELKIRTCDNGTCSIVYFFEASPCPSKGGE